MNNFNKFVSFGTPTRCRCGAKAMDGGMCRACERDMYRTIDEKFGNQQDRGWDSDYNNTNIKAMQTY